uniref:DNA-repair protein Xrcc1 N-terminal domain-containing protein n=1 Tax=Parascaris equorum TaxID=6256 RepID=A0A914RY47_PAREQ
MIMLRSVKKNSAMPLAKFKFIVSSSESEQGYEAENLLVNGRARTKWKGKAGELCYQLFVLCWLCY